MNSYVYLTVEPDEVLRLPVEEHRRHFERKYRRPIRKAIHFLLVEGPLETYRKYRSKRVEREVEADQAILLCAWTHERQRRIGVTRDLGGQPRFHPALVFAGDELASLDDIHLSQAALRLLESFLPVPECPLAGEVADVIRGANPGLRPVLELAAEGEDPLRDVAYAPGAVRRSSGRSVPGRVFLLGYGSYVREQVLPCFRGQVAAAVDYKAELLRGRVQADFPIERELAAVLPAIAAARRPLVIVATYHSNHAASALRVLDANPEACVFVEKPAAVTVEDAGALAERRRAGAWIDIGFNRRYAAFTRWLDAAAGRASGPRVFNALVKELKIPLSHWYHWPNQGTRVTGNLCHWIDLAHYLFDEPCVEVKASGSGGSVSALLRFRDGSLATLSATDAGDDLRGVTEHLELRSEGTTVVVDDYRRVVELAGGRRRTRRSLRDKGHRLMYQDLKDRWLKDGSPRYPAGHIRPVAEVTAEVVRSLQGGPES